MAFQVSTAKISITPPSGMNPYMAGYGQQVGQRTITTDTPYAAPLYARCVILWDSGSPNCMVVLDVLALPPEVHQAIRPKLIALANWASSDIMMGVTHTHNGPVLGSLLDPFISYSISDLDPINAYTTWLETQVVTVVKNALAATKTTVTLDYTVASATFSANREGLPYNETAVPTLTARGTNGKPVAIIFSYGCHPVSAGGQNQWDGDWPQGACTYIESNTSAFALFVQGPAGDQNPTGDVYSWTLRDQLSQAMGSTIVSATKNAGRALTGGIGTSLTSVTLPLDLTNTPANLAAVRACFVTRMANPSGFPSWYIRHAEAMISRIDNNQITTTVVNPLQVWTIDGSTPLTMVFVGSELVSGYAVYFRNLYGGPSDLYIGGYANEVHCYIPANNLLPPLLTTGSYAGGWDTDFPGIAGENLTVYPQIAHFLAGTNGVESTLINAITAQLS
jgi:neutral ceramidase